MHTILRWLRGPPTEKIGRGLKLAALERERRAKERRTEARQRERERERERNRKRQTKRFARLFRRGVSFAIIYAARQLEK